MKKLIFVVLLCSILLVSCDTYQLELSKDTKPYTVLNQNVVRFIDVDAGVVCWIYSHQEFREGGISCLPIGDTLLFP